MEVLIYNGTCLTMFEILKQKVRSKYLNKKYFQIGKTLLKI